MPADSVLSPIDFGRLEASVDASREAFLAASPYPHIVIDGLLHPSQVELVYEEVDQLATDGFVRYLHLNERKFANTDPSTWGDGLNAVATALQSDRFVAYLSRLSGIEDLIADPTLDGGGLHRSTQGGHLNIHADFTAHHVHAHWRRRLNLILYLNRSWDPDWGGALELWSSDMKRCERLVEPVGNRAVIFATDDDSFHGHPTPMTCPPDVYRQSLALYYFTVDPTTRVDATNYRSRPEDSRWRSAGIWADRQALRAYDSVKRRLGLSDDAVSRWLGRLDRFRSRGRGGAGSG